MSEPSLFDSSPAPAAAGIPSGRDWLAQGLTPRQGFARRYPAAIRVRGMAMIDLVASGLATPAMRAEFDAWYREHWGAPGEVPLPSVHEVHDVHQVHPVHATPER